MDTWWCGEPVALQSAFHHFNHIALKPTYPPSDGHQSFPGVLTKSLNRKWTGKLDTKIKEQPNEYTVQNYLPLAQMPNMAQLKNRP
jgi:uncharacterized circularly permuted ATP-grasp superfamily protein